MKDAKKTLLVTELDEAYQSLRDRLIGLTDDEFFWEPVPDCWTVHEDESGHWIEDYELPAPDPAPFTTIGWRLIHLATCKIMYHEYAFGAQKLTWDDIEIPHTAASAIAMFEEGHKRLKDVLLQLNEADLEKMVLTNWGEQWSIRQIFWVMISHDLHHGGEIACLRDLFKAIHYSPA